MRWSTRWLRSASLLCRHSVFKLRDGTMSSWRPGASQRRFVPLLPSICLRSVRGEANQLKDTCHRRRCSVRRSLSSISSSSFRETPLLSGHQSAATRFVLVAISASNRLQSHCVSDASISTHIDLSGPRAAFYIDQRLCALPHRSCELPSAASLVSSSVRAAGFRAPPRRSP